jgi:hypothetical protein
VEGTLMTTYRFLWLDERGYASKSMQIECVTDRQAIDIAEHQTGDYEMIEVWNGPRPVCRCGNPDKSKKG